MSPTDPKSTRRVYKEKCFATCPGRASRIAIFARSHISTRAKGSAGPQLPPALTNSAGVQHTQARTPAPAHTALTGTGNQRRSRGTWGPVYRAGRDNRSHSAEVCAKASRGSCSLRASLPAEHSLESLSAAPVSWPHCLAEQMGGSSTELMQGSRRPGPRAPYGAAVGGNTRPAASLPGAARSAAGGCSGAGRGGEETKDALTCARCCSVQCSRLLPG